MDGFNPVLGVAMIVVILNLGVPLDYHLILGLVCLQQFISWLKRRKIFWCLF